MSKMTESFVAYVDKLEELVESQKELIHSLTLLNEKKDCKIEMLEETIELLRKERDSH